MRTGWTGVRAWAGANVDERWAVAPLSAVIMAGEVSLGDPPLTLTGTEVDHSLAVR